MDSYPGMPLEQFVREASLAELMGYASDDGMNLLSTLVLRKDLDTASKLLDRGFPPDENK